jgi:hypothetical protein
MNNEQKETLDALDRIIRWAQARELPPGEWTIPLQKLIDGQETPEYLKLFPLPLVVYGKGGVVEFGNITFQDETYLSADDISSGKVIIKNYDHFDFDEAMKLALRGETHVINDFKVNPMEYFSDDVPDDVKEYKTALFFSIFNDEAPTRGAILFLPIDWRPENA